MDTPNNRLYKIFLVRNLKTSYFRNCFTVSFKISWVFVILFFIQFNDLFRSTKIKIRRNFQSVFTSMVDALPVPKMSKAKWDRDRNMDAIMEIYVAHSQPPLLYSEN